MPSKEFLRKLKKATTRPMEQILTPAQKERAIEHVTNLSAQGMYIGELTMCRELKINRTVLRNTYAADPAFNDAMRDAVELAHEKRMSLYVEAAIDMVAEGVTCADDLKPLGQLLFPKTAPRTAEAPKVLPAARQTPQIPSSSEVASHLEEQDGP